ncbi:acyl-CoA dehydrogenase [marine bacterium AO1-C]|nr:acyl-CoA dehydrogenase [marine bacterium AO1-C]
MQKHLLEEEHKMFQDAVKAFMEKEVAPHNKAWAEQGHVSREIWQKAGAQGMLCMDLPEKYGGMGIKDFRYNAIVGEELAKVGASGPGFILQNDVMAPYFTEYFTDEQKERWMPGLISGDIISAIAMTEPGTGSDLQAIQTTAIDQGDHYLLNGSKTFITNGILSDLIIVVAKTDPKSQHAHAGISLIIVERDMEGFTRGKNLDKIGMKAQDTAELFFNDVKVPKNNLLGKEGQGFYYLMRNLPQERLSIAATGCAAAEAALDMTIQYCKDRKAFGRPIGKFQNSRFALAEMKTEVTIARTFVDQCIMELNKNKLSVEKAAMAKYWVTDLQCKVVDQCLQLHGGYGYMSEFPIAQAYIDSRVQRIYGGTNEIMKEIIGRGMGF